jgi:LysR family glycine cleavage system transcriptional activator
MLSYPDLFAKQYKEGKLSAPFDEKMPTSDNYFLAFPEGRPLSKSATVFRDWLREEMRVF